MKVISVEHLSKSYRLGQIGTGTFTRDMQVWWARVRGRPNPLARIGEAGRSAEDGVGELLALRDISFQVKQGEVLGIIGRNGAGKSTLLKILSRVTAPTSGVVKVKGRIASLLEVGTGFHPELTGRENVYLNGAILGMSRKEIAGRFDEIVDFAGVEQFIDTPVKRYSSGMYVRLAFAVAAHLDPEILVVDEVLAVGDAEFQKKCLGKMGEVAGEGRTVLFVSHNMGAVNSLCSRAVYLDSGEIVQSGPVQGVISKYIHSSTNGSGEIFWEEGISNQGVDEISIRAIRIVNNAGVTTTKIEAQQDFIIEIDYRVLKRMPNFRVGLILTTYDGITVFQSYDEDSKSTSGFRIPGDYSSECVIPGNFLSPGRFFFSVNIGIRGVRNLIWLENALFFDVEDSGTTVKDDFRNRRGIIAPKLLWRENQKERN